MRVDDDALPWPVGFLDLLLPLSLFVSWITYDATNLWPHGIGSSQQARTKVGGNMPARSLFIGEDL
jgi:hypothetical protein